GRGLLRARGAGPPDEFRTARADLLRGQIAFASRRGSDAPPLLLKAARQLEPFDPRLARETYLEALAAALYAGRLALGAGTREVAEAASAAPRPPQPARPHDLLLDGLALLITDGHAAGAPLLKQAVTKFRSADVTREEGLRWLYLACHAAVLAWDYESWDVLSARLITLARDAGALTALPLALGSRAQLHLFGGDFAVADSLVAEVESVTKATGSSMVPYTSVTLAAFRGRETEALEQIEARTKDVQLRGEGKGLGFIQWATALMCNGLGRYQQALAAAE